MDIFRLGVHASALAETSQGSLVGRYRPKNVRQTPGIALRLMDENWVGLSQHLLNLFLVCGVHPIHEDAKVPVPIQRTESLDDIDGWGHQHFFP
jgi:hypothetical protein